MPKHYILILLVSLLSLTVYPQQIDGGNGHAIILTKEGNVLTTGRNNFGQLGINSTKSSNRTVRVNGLPIM